MVTKEKKRSILHVKVQETHLCTIIFKAVQVACYSLDSSQLKNSRISIPFGFSLGPGHTAARFGFLYAKRCSLHGYCSKILKLQREARRSEKRPEGQLLALLAAAAEKSAGCSACNVRRNVRSRSSSFVFSFFFFFFFDGKEKFLGK